MPISRASAQANRWGKRIMESALATCLIAGCAVACRAQTTEADLTTRLAGKPLLLRGTWADDKLSFDGAGKPQGNYKTAPFSICGIDVTKVQVSGDRMRIEGQRMALEFSRKGDVSRVPIPAGKLGDHKPEVIRIDIKAGAGNDFSAALDAVFTDDLAAMVPQMPDFWQPYARKHFLPAGKGDTSRTVPPKSIAEKPVDERPLAPGPKPERPMRVGGGVKPPRVLQMKEAEFSEAARRLKFSGNVLVSLQVGPDGLPTHIAVVQPVGYGLDEKAVSAVSQYTFSPATFNDKKVAVELNIEVNFQIF